MNSAHEAMLLIKEKMLELKEKELNLKMSVVENNFKDADCDFGSLGDGEIEEEIKQPIFVNGSPAKQNMELIRMKEENKKVRII